jgi:hypothetical protein
MEDRLSKIEQAIQSLNERNIRVEAEKSWEVSFFRKALITIITYVIASLVLYIIGAQNFFLSALIPTVGYILSTQSLPVIKRWWIRNKSK